MNIPTTTEIIEKKNCAIPYINSHYTEFCTYLDSTYPNKKRSEQLYRYFYGDPKPCPVCGGEPKYINFIKGFRTYCTSKCMSIATGAQRGQTFKSKNAEDPTRMSKIVAARNQSKIDRCGSLEEANKQMLEKYKATCLEKYGTTNGGWSEPAQEKIKETCQERFGSDSPFGSDIIQNKVKQTNQKNLGVDYPLQSKEIRSKYSQICFERYGGKLPTQLKQIKERSVQTCMKKYGVPYGFLNTEPGYSKSSQEYFDSLKAEHPNAVYATNGGEYKVGPYLLDWYDPDTNTAIEFNGDYWHANPKFYNPEWIHPVKKCSAKEIWNKDIEKMMYLMEHGIDVKVVWESEIKKGTT